MQSRSLLTALLILAFVTSAEAYGDSLQNGAYLVRIAGCADCHTADARKPMAGGLRLPSPFGDFFTPNITPDIETGIGTWSESDFVRALRLGKRPDGKLLYPAFPYRAYTQLTDSDLHDMFVYLRQLTPIHAQNLPHQLNFLFGQRWLVNFWQEFFFGAGPFRPDKSKSEIWNRGAYLVEGLAHCTECHTPRNRLGGLETSLWMSGNSQILPGKVIPNITPDRETGRPWTKRQWMRFLTSGYSPSYKTPGAEMADVIQNTSFLNKSDREAMVEYLMSLKPIRRVP